MSSMANWTYVYPLTIWKVTIDQFQQTVFGEPYLIAGDWMAGGDTATDSNGVQFIATSKYHFEAQDGSPLIPSPQDYILRGDHTEVADPSTIGAEVIRKVEGWGMQMFGADELPDWRILT